MRRALCFPGLQVEMSRSVAILVLVGFAVAAVSVAYWGTSEVTAWIGQMQQCHQPVVIDTSSFWFCGFIGIALLPFLSIFGSKSTHRFMLSLVVVLFLGLPLASFGYGLSVANEHGYGPISNGSIFQLEKLQLVSSRCNS